jgi:signal transduction histidine kinase
VTVRERPIRVLVIEDNEDDFASVRLALGGAARGFDVRRAKAFAEAVARLESDGADVLLVDLNLPDSEGMDTFLRLNSRAPDVPVIVLTGLDDEAVAEEAVRRGAQDYLFKGRTPPESLVRAIRYSLERHRSQEALRQYREHLETIVEARTAELRRANEALLTQMDERSRAEGERETLRRELGEARRIEALARVAAGVAHEFNNALMAIAGYGHLARNRLEPQDPAREYVAQILAAAERAAAFTRKLVAFSSSQPLQPAVLDVSAFLDCASAIVRPLLGEAIELVTSPSQNPIYVKADARRMEQLVTDLALNAREAMPDGGIFRMRAQSIPLGPDPARGRPAHGTFACLRFEDTGVGMDRDTAQLAFEPFFTTKAFGPSSGLGLSVAYGIARQHGGWIEVESSPGQGSCFRVFLPEVGGTQAAERVGV